MAVESELLNSLAVLLTGKYKPDEVAEESAVISKDFFLSLSSVLMDYQKTEQAIAFAYGNGSLNGRICTDWPKDVKYVTLAEAGITRS